MKRVVLMAALLMTSTAAFAAADQHCLTLVFERFCLGGTSATLPDAGRVITRDGNKHYYNESGDMVMAEVRDGRIVAVVRVLTPSDHLTFMEYSERISRRYGPPREQGFLPAYVNNGQAMEAAVNARQGHLDRVWNRGDWTLRLIWTELGMGLAYSVNH